MPSRAAAAGYSPSRTSGAPVVVCWRCWLPARRLGGPAHRTACRRPGHEWSPAMRAAGGRRHSRSVASRLVDKQVDPSPSTTPTGPACCLRAAPSSSDTCAIAVATGSAPRRTSRVEQRPGQARARADQQVLPMTLAGGAATTALALCAGRRCAASGGRRRRHRGRLPPLPACRRPPDGVGRWCALTRTIEALGVVHMFQQDRHATEPPAGGMRATEHRSRTGSVVAADRVRHSPSPRCGPRARVHAAPLAGRARAPP